MLNLYWVSVGTHVEQSECFCFLVQKQQTGKNIHMCDDLYPGPGCARMCLGLLVMDHQELVLIGTGHGALHPAPLWGNEAQQLSAEQWMEEQCADSCPDPQAQLLFSTAMYK